MKRNLLIVWLILAVAGPGCNLNLAKSGLPAGGGATRAWFDSPLPGSIYVSPSPVCPVVAHGGSPAGIASFELTINGVVTMIPSPDTKSSLATLTRNCDLSEPGRYFLRLRVQDNAGVWSGYAETSLIISAAVTGTPGTVTATLSPTPTPTLTSTPSPLGGVSILSISTDVVYVGGTSCGPQQVTIVAHATAPKGIKVVVLFFRFQPGSPSGFQDVAMNPIGGDNYQVTLDPNSILGGFLTADQVTLQYQVVVQQNDGDTSIRTPVLADIAVLPCGNAVQDCSSYHKKSACESHGCVWYSTAGTATPGAVNECQSP
jgi:hypothetical protein